MSVISANEGFQPVLLHAASNAAGLSAMAAQYPGALAILADGADARLLDALSLCGADVVVNGIAGAAGLRPTLAAVRAGLNTALANKESIVMAGSLVLSAAKAAGAAVIPVDSEHSAIHSLLCAHKSEAPCELLLTASGGPFRTYTRAQLEAVTPAQALAHPTWKMGPKISVDSATMANKGLEVIEASLLFGFPADTIKVIIHPQSVVHSMIRVASGAVYAQLSRPDMRLAIANALSWPAPPAVPFGVLDWQALSLDFELCEPGRFPMLDAARDAAMRGGLYPAAFNAANEVAVSAFLRSRIRFVDIYDVTARTMCKDFEGDAHTLDAIFDADAKARALAAEYIVR
jgi:1-deoxy-D-xylulose-5-phosphate reductoisomerase